MKIRTKCGGEFSEFSALQNFKTASCKLEGEASDNAEGIMVFPNPATNSIIIFSQENIAAGTYTISDLNGKVILSGKLSGIAVNISSLHSGIYFIAVSANGNTFFKKINVQHQ